MVRSGRLVSKDELKTSFLEQCAKQGAEMLVYMDYDPLVDIWIIRFDWSSEETVVHYLNEYVGLIYYADSRQIIGIQVENFESGVLNNHPQAVESIQTWREVSTNFDGFKAVRAADLPVDRLIEAVLKATETDLDEPIVELAAALHF